MVQTRREFLGSVVAAGVTGVCATRRAHADAPLGGELPSTGSGPELVEGSRARAREVFPPPLRGRIKVGGMNRGQARKLRKNPTDAEKVLWKHLRLRQVEGHKFRRQHP